MHKAEEMVARAAIVSRIVLRACRDADINGSFRQALQCLVQLAVMPHNGNRDRLFHICLAPAPNN